MKRSRAASWSFMGTVVIAVGFSAVATYGASASSATGAPRPASGNRPGDGDREND